MGEIQSDKSSSNGVIFSCNIAAIITEEIGSDTDDLLDGTKSSHRGGVDHLLLDNLRVRIVVLGPDSGLKLSLSGPHETWTNEGW